MKHIKPILYVTLIVAAYLFAAKLVFNFLIVATSGMVSCPTAIVGASLFLCFLTIGGVYAGVMIMGAINRRKRK